MLADNASHRPEMCRMVLLLLARHKPGLTEGTGMNHSDARTAYRELTARCADYSRKHTDCALRDNPYFVALLGLEEKMDKLGIATGDFA